jgi:HEAT repeat protein
MEEEINMELDRVLKEIATYKFGQSRVNLIAVADCVRDSHSNADERVKLRQELTALLGSDATADCKKFVCEQLSIIGTAEDVPTLATLLTDEELSHMARVALERIPVPSANGALLDALGKTKGKILVGVINSLGERHDRASVASLARFVADADETVASAAAAALGKIAGQEAIKVLTDAKSAVSPNVRPIVGDALLNCAEQLLGGGNKDEAGKIYRDLTASPEVEPVREAARLGLKAAQQK